MNKGMTVFVSILVFLFSLLNPGFAQDSPDKFLGVSVGADKVLVKYPDIIRYFQYIDSQSDRVKFSEEGSSTLGNGMYAAFISAEENIRNLDRLIAVNKKLANPDTISADEAKRLTDEAKVFILVTCTIHATEVASSQYAMQLVHKLAITQDPTFKGYLNNVVLILMPSINPDGQIMVTEWYDKYKNTDLEGCNMPYLYHHYAGHDNNRDFYMLNLKESQVVNAVLHHRYFPQIYLDMHQMGSTGPRMFVPPFKDPLNANLDPLMLRETDIIGGFMAWKLQEQNKKGVASSYAFDAYWPGGSKNTAWYKNVVGLLTELASAKIASPIFIEPNELRVRSKGLAEYKAQVNFPDPWTGGWWRIADIIEYERIAVEALLEVTAKNRRAFVHNFYRMGLDAVAKGKNDAPYGYIVPTEQWDQPAVYTFLKKMKEAGVRIFRLSDDTQLGSTQYKRGAYVIPTAQPYRAFVNVMMEKQRYPEIKHMRNGPIMEPYDASGWTLPLLMGVKWSVLDTPFHLLKTEVVTSVDYPETEVVGDGSHYLLPARFNRSVLAVNRLLKKNLPVFRFCGETESAGLLPGDFLVPAVSLDAGALADVLTGTGVAVNRVNVPKNAPLLGLKAPRIGIYQAYVAGMDEGWTRWVLDHFEFPFLVLHNNDFIAKNFAKGLDVIIFPSMARDLIVEGKVPGQWSRYLRNMPEEFKGGIGAKGLTALKNWVKTGGSLVVLDQAYDLAAKDFQLPLTNVLKDVKEEQFYCPGSILRIDVNPADPIAWGMEKESFIYFSNSPAFRTQLPLQNYINRRVSAQFSAEGPHLLSGFLKGGNLLNRAVTTVRFDYYKGSLIVLGGRVQNRSQTFGTFKFLFNALYFNGLINHQSNK